MSEQQKVFASLSGSLIGHLLLLIAVFFLVAATQPNNRFSSTRKPPEKPKEITLMLTDLMKKIEPAPEPVIPKTKPQPAKKQFLNTDLNTPAKLKPKNASYESDRNSVASSKLMPDINKPRVTGVTLQGDERVPLLELLDRDFADDESDQPSKTKTTETITEKAPSQSPDASADRITQPDAPPSSSTRARMAESEKSFVLPASKTSNRQLSPNGTDADRQASSNKENREQERPTTPDEKKKSPGDVAASKSGFSPVKVQSAVNGSLTNKGENAMDVEESAMGRYKKSVTDAIARKWHRFRKDNADLVTWGTLKLSFKVTADGQVKNLTIKEDKSNALLKEFTLKAIQEASIPTMPKEVSEKLGTSGLEMNYDVIIY